MAYNLTDHGRVWWFMTMNIKQENTQIALRLKLKYNTFKLKMNIVSKKNKNLAFYT